jgi:hypothetical protein
MVCSFACFHGLGILASTLHTLSRACLFPSSSTSATASTTVAHAALLVLPGVRRRLHCCNSRTASPPRPRSPCTSLLHLDLGRRLYRRGSVHHDPLPDVALVRGHTTPSRCSAGPDHGRWRAWRKVHGPGGTKLMGRRGRGP